MSHSHSSSTCEQRDKWTTLTNQKYSSPVAWDKQWWQFTDGVGSAACKPLMLTSLRSFYVGDVNVLT